MCQIDTYSNNGCFLPYPVTPVMKELYCKLFITIAVIAIVSTIALDSIGQTAKDWERLAASTPSKLNFSHTFIREIYVCKLVAYAAFIFFGVQQLYKTYRQLNNPVHIVSSEIRRTWNDIFN